MAVQLLQQAIDGELSLDPRGKGGHVLALEHPGAVVMMSCRGHTLVSAFPPGISLHLPNPPTQLVTLLIVHLSTWLHNHPFVACSHPRFLDALHSWLLHTDIELMVLEALGASGPHALPGLTWPPALADLVSRLMPLAPEQWAMVPGPCEGFGRLLPVALAVGDSQVLEVMARLPPADASRLRTLALCLHRTQIPQPQVRQIISLSLLAAA